MTSDYSNCLWLYELRDKNPLECLKLSFETNFLEIVLFLHKE